MRKKCYFGFALGTFVITTAAQGALVDGLAGYYPFDADLSNKATNGTSLNATLLTGTPVAGATDGQAGKALDLVKTETDAIRVPFGTGVSRPAANGNLGTSFTISAWYNHSGATSTGGGRSFVFESSNMGIFDISYGSTTTANQYTSYVGGDAAGSTITGPNIFHHVLQRFTSDGTNTTLDVFIDGELQVAGAAGTTGYTDNVNETADFDFSALNVGRARDGADLGGRYFNGQIDELAIWTRPLSNAEVGQVFALDAGGQSLPVPEPTAAGLIAIGAGLLGARRRRGAAH